MQLKTKMAKIDDAIHFFEKIVESDKDLYYRHSFEDDSYHLLSKTNDAIEFYSQCAEWLKELKQLREERPIKQVTCKDCKNLQNDWGTLRCDYTGDIVDEEWYCKAAKAREVTDE